jgi:hypothetical protein
MSPKLTKKQIRGLKTLSLAYTRFTPIQLLTITHEVAEQLVHLGLAEKGESFPRYKEVFGYDVGYRLTRAGAIFLNDRRSLDKGKVS